MCHRKPAHQRLDRRHTGPTQRAVRKGYRRGFLLRKSNRTTYWRDYLFLRPHGGNRMVRSPCSDMLETAATGPAGRLVVFRATMSRLLGESIRPSDSRIALLYTCDHWLLRLALARFGSGRPNMAAPQVLGHHHLSYADGPRLVTQRTIQLVCRFGIHLIAV
jgi:hypothetical protein